MMDVAEAMAISMNWSAVFTPLLILIIICCVILLIVALSGRIDIAKAEVDDDKKSWYTWQFLGVTVLIKDKGICIALMLVALVIVITVSYCLGIEAFF